MLRDGDLDENEIEVMLPVGGDKTNPAIHFDATGANPDLEKKLGEVLGVFGKRTPATERKKVTILEAKEAILNLELDRLLEGIDLKKMALASVEESGIVFIDEIDKICTSRDAAQWRSDASADGVQRDLLPLVEGTTINTKFGNVKTDYILFVASGAFHAVKPSDMLPELQGRLPIRVELQGLTESDLYKILTEPVANVSIRRFECIVLLLGQMIFLRNAGNMPLEMNQLVRQQVELLATEGITLQFNDDAVREIARMAALVNRTVENIGARRLHTVMERIMEDLSFEAAEMERGSVLIVDKELVQERLADVSVSTDLSRYIL